MAISRGLFIGSGKRYEGALDADGADVIARISLSPKSFTPQAATTGNFDLTTQPGVLIEDAFFVLRQNFTGGAVGTATISMGPSATPTTFVLATTVFTGASKTVGAVNAEKGTALTSVSSAFVNVASPWSTGTLRIQLIVTGANISVLTTGKLDAFVVGRISSARS